MASSSEAEPEPVIRKRRRKPAAIEISSSEDDDSRENHVASSGRTESDADSDEVQEAFAVEKGKARDRSGSPLKQSINRSPQPTGRMVTVMVPPVPPAKSKASKPTGRLVKTEDKKKAEMVQSSSEEDLGDEAEVRSGSDEESSDPMELDDEDEKPQRAVKSTVSSSNTLGRFLGKSIPVPPVKTKAKAKPRKPTGATAGLKKKEKETIDEHKLAPISDIQEMFMDIIRRTPDFEDVVRHLNGRKLRVATMCSGTESPLLALGMISNAVKSLWDLDLSVEHVFSCEIEPFKQAYIERNFQPPILFRDVCELGEEEATTAYGSKVAVPGGVDLLVAGTSCVDYSNLNNQKKGIDQGGESGRTFSGMLKWVQKTQPPVVLLENVCNAPWDRVVEKFEGIDYDAEYSRFDTKHYYIPHTRTRVYLVATPKALRRKGVATIPKAWLSAVSNMARPASVPLEAFMYSVDDPRIHEARRQLAFIRQSKDGQSRSATDWGRCESRHARARAEEELGDKRPLTAWQDGPVCKMTDGGWDDWANAQTERVVDLMDINLLRLAKLGVDVQYKTLIWNLSQNVDRTTGSGKYGIAPCLTPNMIAYVTNRGGPLIGREALSLQGIPTQNLLLTKESEDQLADLAGNAMSTTVVGSSIIAALVLARRALTKGEDEMSIDARPPTLEEVESRVGGHDKLEQAPLDLSTTEPIAPGFFDRATASARLCICEGRAAVCQSKIMRCQDCGFTSCLSCGGRPRHNYLPLDLERLAVSRFEHELKKILPMRLTLAGLTLETFDQVASSATGLDVVDDDWALLRDEILAAVPGVEFHFKALKRQQIWVAVFDAPKAQLELRFDPGWPEWRLSVKPDPTAPIKSRSRLLLESPVARLPISSKSDDILAGRWQFRLPVDESFELSIEGIGDVVPGWSKDLGLTTEAAKTDDRWSSFTLAVPEDAKAYLDRSLDGIWTLHADCGTAQNMLHRKTPSPGEEELPPLFLFLDPTRSGEVDQDGAVFSIDHSRQDYGSSRPVVATVDPSWRPSAENTKASCRVSSKWVVAESPVLTSSLQTSSRAEEAIPDAVHGLPVRREAVSINAETCKSSTAVVTCKVPLPAGQIGEIWGGKDWHEVDVMHAGEALFEALAWLTERIPKPAALEAWIKVDQAEEHGACQRCAPEEPAVEWRQDSSGKKWQPYEDVVQAGRYEQALKHRPTPFVAQLRHVDGCGEFRLGINIATLVHRAASRFPPVTFGSAPSLSWHVNLEHDGSITALRRPRFRFQISSNKLDPSAEQPPRFRKKKLRPEQLRSLSWMLDQERLDSVSHTFVEEEIAEAVLEPLGWRAEGKAERRVLVRGGVLADEVGYGKTVITIGLVDATLDDAKACPPDLPDDEVEGLIRVHATLVIVPAHLGQQWPDEFAAFTGQNKVKVLQIMNMAHLNKVTIEDIQDADVVVVSETLFNAELYWTNLSRLAGTADIPKDKDGGRFFRARFDEAVAGLRTHTAILTDEEEGGADAMRTAIEEAHKERQAAEALRKHTNSKRLVGAAYAKQYAELSEDTSESDGPPRKKAKAAPKGKAQSHGGDVWKLSSRDTRNDWSQMHCPPLHMFHWHRRVVDEYTYLSGTVRTAVGGIQSYSTWILSGTPPVANFAEIKSIASLLRIHLGIDDDAEGDRDTAKAREKQQTAAERFHSFREMRSAAWHQRRDQVAQTFLDRFVRQNVAEIDEIPYEERLDAIVHPAAERAIYLELDHHIQSMEMNSKKVMRKAKAGAADRETRYAAILGNSKTPEEALLKRCSHFTTDLNAESSAHKAAHAGAACSIIHDERAAQLDECEADIRVRVKQAVALFSKTLKEGSYEDDDRKPPFHDYLRECFGNVGDSEAGERLRRLLKDAGCSLRDGKVQVPKIADNDPDLEPVSEALNAKGASDEVRKARKWAAREACHALRRLTKELVGRHRSKRYFAVVRNVQQGSPSVITNADGKEEPLAILSTCGHSGPLSSVAAAARAQECSLKAEDGCNAPARETSVVRADTLGLDDDSGRFGIKLERLAWLISRTPRDTRSLVFVQFEDLLDKVWEALQYHGIGVVRVKGSAVQRMKVLTGFQNAEDPNVRVLLLHAADSSASGANLTGANYAFFVSPLLMPSADKYRACETQAVGRLRRYGQTKKVHIIRLLVVDTIDTDIYGRRHDKTPEELAKELEHAQATQPAFELLPSPTKKSSAIDAGTPSRKAKKKAQVVVLSDDDESD